MVENSREALVELAERVEKAEGADREIDAEIAVVLSAHPNARIMDMDGFRVPVAGGDTDATFDIMLETPAYTASLDAAMLLLDPKALWAVGSMEEGPFARVCWPMPNGGDVGGYAEGKGATAANSLVSAALRARSAALS